MENPSAGLTADGKPYTFKPMLYHVSLFMVFNKVLHDRFYRESAESKVCALHPVNRRRLLLCPCDDNALLVARRSWLVSPSL